MILLDFDGREIHFLARAWSRIRLTHNWTAREE